MSTVEFSKCVGIPLLKIFDEMPEINLMGNKDELVKTIWITAIGIAFLEVKFGDLRDEWILLIEKSTRFIKKHVGQDQLAFILQSAKSLVSLI